MLTNYAANAEIKGFVDKYDYYLFPIVNPDGKSLSQLMKDRVLNLLQASSTPKPPTDFGERTVRQFPQAPALDETSTVTGHSSKFSPIFSYHSNRWKTNIFFRWAATGGASTDPCNETYKGKSRYPSRVCVYC